MPLIHAKKNEIEGKTNRDTEIRHHGEQVEVAVGKKKRQIFWAKVDWLKGTILGAGWSHMSQVAG